MENGVWLVICGMGPGPGPGVFRIEEGTYEIGRSKECHIRLFHSSVSRRHAVLTLEGDRLRVRDLDSGNGTFVDGKPIEYAPLGTGSSLKIGHVSLEVMEHLWNECVSTSDGDGTDLAPVQDDADAWVRASGFGPQRKEVLALLLDGLPEKKIAGELHMSENTVDWHRKEIYRILDVHSRAELSAHFRKNDSIPMALASLDSVSLSSTR